MQTGALASYNAVENKIYLLYEATQRKRLLELQKDLAVPQDYLSTYMHEVLHWLDAQRYTAKYGEITRKNLFLYFKKLRQHDKRQLDRLGISVDNVAKISAYAEFSLANGEYDEVFT